MVDLAALGVPPAAWFLHLNISYVLVPPSCRADHGWFLAAVTVVALAAMVPPARHSLRARDAADGQDLRSFLGTTGIWLTSFFAVVTVLVGLSALMVHPCR